MNGRHIYYASVKNSEKLANGHSSQLFKKACFALGESALHPSAVLICVAICRLLRVMWQK
jgi:hypothetical protein